MSNENKAIGRSASSDRGPIAIVAAMEDEIRPLQRHLDRPQKHLVGKQEIFAGELGRSRVVVVTTGDGANAATRGLTAVLESMEMRAIVVVGVAGALSPDLGKGSVVVCSQVRDEAGHMFEMDSDLVIKASRFEVAKMGMAISVDSIASNASQKRRLWQQYGSLPAQVVDLESAAYADLAARREIPCLVIRVVSDGHDESLPLDFNQFRNTDGGVDRAGVLREALRHPSLMPKLLKLRDRVRSSAVVLDQMVREVIVQ